VLTPVVAEAADAGEVRRLVPDVTPGTETTLDAIELELEVAVESGIPEDDTPGPMLREGVEVAEGGKPGGVAPGETEDVNDDKPTPEVVDMPNGVEESVMVEPEPVAGTDSPDDAETPVDVEVTDDTEIPDEADTLEDADRVPLGLEVPERLDML